MNITITNILTITKREQTKSMSPCRIRKAMYKKKSKDYFNLYLVAGQGLYI